MKNRTLSSLRAKTSDPMSNTVSGTAFEQEMDPCEDQESQNNGLGKPGQPVGSNQQQTPCPTGDFVDDSIEGEVT